MAIISDNLSTLDQRKPSWIDQWFRQLLFKRLGGFRQGALIVSDNLGERQFGAENQDETNLAPVVVEVSDTRFYRQICLHGSLGAAETYMDGLWSCSDLPALFEFFHKNQDQTDAMDSGISKLSSLLESLRHRWRRNTKQGSKQNIHQHYDLGNELFKLFLDETMTYSSAIYPSADSTLYQASVHKLDTICRKLELKADDHVIEIGTGWGSFAIHAAANYGCRVTTTTISDQQYSLAAKKISQAGMGDRIQLLKQDYRDLDQHYDKLVSIEMAEAVGHRFLEDYFRQCAQLLKSDGSMLIQVISMPDQRYDQYLKNSDFIQRFVFPGSCCPALTAIMDAVKNATDLKLVHLEDIAPHYARTLEDWRRKFNQHLPEVETLGYSRRFIRMWNYYLSYCEVGFAQRYLSDYQLLFNKPLSRLTYGS